MTVRVLDEATILRIAAGEVVERPCSMLKELCENALDAGARRITVRLVEGGIRLVEVADDGEGISEEDLPRVVLRHATSKIERPEDLDRVSTYGFRGEALAAIAEAATLAVVSRPRGGEGRRLVRDGETWAAAPSAADFGSVVSARDLFARAPARRKFLSTPRGEAMRCLRILERMALARPDVAWRCLSDGEEVLSTPGTDLRAAAVAVFGREKGEALLDVEGILPYCRVAGLVAPPERCEKTRGGLHFAVNGRIVEAGVLLTAVRTAYETLLPPGRNPVGFVALTIDPAEVDVNAHPTKREIRFRGSNEVFRAVSQSVRSRIRGHREAESYYGPTAPASDSSVSDPFASDAVRETASFVSAAPGVPSEDLFGSDAPEIRLEGRIAGRYLVGEDAEGLVLVDLHAAHERVLFDRLLAEAESSRAVAAPFLLPITLSLSPAAREAAVAAAEDLARIGFEVEPFGPSELLLRSVPAALAGRGDPARLVAALAEELAEDPVRGTRPPYETIARRACHRAVRTGDPLGPTEARALLLQLHRTRDPQRCPHGRPTMLRIPVSELDRRFGRAGVL